jgi:hypothetical protein
MLKSTVTFDIDKVKEPIFLFENKQQWDNSPYSFQTYKRLWEANKGIIKFKDTSNDLAIAFCEPLSFPCIALQGPRVRLKNQPDEIVFFFIYDFIKESTPL